MSDDRVPPWGDQVRAETLPDLRAQILQETNGCGNREIGLAALLRSHQFHEYTYRAQLLSIHVRSIVLETENTKVKKTQTFLQEAYLLTDWWGRQSHANYKL